MANAKYLMRHWPSASEDTSILDVIESISRSVRKTIAGWNGPGYNNDELCRKLTAPSMIRRDFTGTLYHEFRAAIIVCLTFLEGRELM